MSMKQHLRGVLEARNVLGEQQQILAKSRGSLDLIKPYIFGGGVLYISNLRQHVPNHIERGYPEQLKYHVALAAASSFHFHPTAH